MTTWFFLMFKPIAKNKKVIGENGEGVNKSANWRRGCQCGFQTKEDHPSKSKVKHWQWWPKNKHKKTMTSFFRDLNKSLKKKGLGFRKVVMVWMKMQIQQEEDNVGLH
jgi:hypothetical protein